MEGSTSVYIWWGGMSAIAVLNMVLLYFTYQRYKKRLPDLTPTIQFIRRFHMAMATIYVFGCGFRSYLPRGDVRRIVLVDHWISAVAIGRSVATVAELAFAAQWAFMLYEIGRSTGNKMILTGSKLIVPLLVIAEIFSWYACTTGNFFGTIIEESLWALSATILVTGFIIARPLYDKIQRRFINMVIAAGSGYVLYMITVDVPAYVRGWLTSQAAGKEYAAVLDGFVEVATQWRYTRDFVDWKYEMIWMTLYFSVAVWGSMLIVNGPRMDRNLK